MQLIPNSSQCKQEEHPNCRRKYHAISAGHRRELEKDKDVADLIRARDEVAPTPSPSRRKPAPHSSFSSPTANRYRRTISEQSHSSPTRRPRVRFYSPQEESHIASTSSTVCFYSFCNVNGTNCFQKMSPVPFPTLAQIPAPREPELHYNYKKCASNSEWKVWLTHPFASSTFLQRRWHCSCAIHPHYW